MTAQKAARARVFPRFPRSIPAWRNCCPPASAVAPRWRTLCLAAAAAWLACSPRSGLADRHTEPPPQTSGSKATHYHGFDLQLGKAVFTSVCLSCHGSGAYGAPLAGYTDHWQPRLEQDLYTLIRHALDGHGRMPAKGNFHSLSDGEVAAAVAYVVYRGRQLIDDWRPEQATTPCDPIDRPEHCSEAELRELMTLQMLWLLGGRETAPP